MTRSRTLHGAQWAAALAVAFLASGCGTWEPTHSEDPGTKESEARRIVRLEESIANARERTESYLAEADGQRARGADGAIDRAATGLRSVRDDLDRLRVRANDQAWRREHLDDLEREAKRLSDRAEQLHADALRESASGAGA